MTNFNARAETDRIRAITPEIDTFYKKAEGVRLPVKIYERNSDTLFLAIHGGGFSAIKEDTENWNGSWMNFQAQYYADKGISSAAISYRDIKLSPEITIFDQIADCADALLFIKEKINFKKLIIMGDSAGGFLALQLGLNEKINADIVIAANPVIDCEPWKFIVKNYADLEKISPMNLINKLDTKFLCMHGNADTVVDYRPTKEFAEKLSAADTKCEYIEFDGINHAFTLSRYQSSDEDIFKYMKIVDKFIGENI